MPRKWGAKKEAELTKRIRRARSRRGKPIPQSLKALAMGRSRTLVRSIGTRGVPGAKVKLKPNETVEQALRRLQKQLKDEPVPRGLTKVRKGGTHR